MFEPWKQITLSTGQNASIDLKMHVLAENLFARFFGFIIRTFVIIFGVLAMFAVTIFGIIIAVFWPVIPFLPIAFVAMAVYSL
jgi:hypothetical protein